MLGTLGWGSSSSQVRGILSFLVISVFYWFLISGSLRWGFEDSNTPKWDFRGSKALRLRAHTYESWRF